ncbi:MAG: host-nuclease inhibitor Gam family protein [Oscillospiraceae bacterium]|nr:host-nuclease inhibitor Gam family protein [Oscillospiraceae bacterium]
MARKRVIEAPSLKSWEDVNDALRQIAEAQIAVGDIESDMQKQIIGAQKVAEEQCKPHKDSIDRQVLKKIIAKRFKKLKKKYPDKYEDFLRFYRLLCKVIDSSPEGETGIPLGNVSSQDFANIYLNELDQYCIRFLGAKLYTRYMDDIVIIAPNKEIAREWLAKIMSARGIAGLAFRLETNGWSTMPSGSLPCLTANRAGLKTQ